MADLSALRTAPGYSGLRAAPSEPAPQLPAPTTQRGEFEKGLGRGYEGLRSGYLKTGELVSRQLGLDDVADGLAKEAEEADQAAAALEYAPAVPSFRDIDSLGAAGDYLAGTAGELVPSAAAMAAGGAVGAATRAGALPGVFAASAGVETGSSYGELQDLTGEDHPGVAAARGLGAAALDTLVPGHMLGRFARPRAGSPLRNIGKTVAEGMVGEGVTETAQEATQLAANAYVDPTFDPFDEASRERLYEAGVKGAVGGGMFGGATGVATEVKRAATAPARMLPAPKKEAGESKGIKALYDAGAEIDMSRVSDEELNYLVDRVQSGEALSPEDAGLLEDVLSRLGPGVDRIYADEAAPAQTVDTDYELQQQLHEIESIDSSLTLQPELIQAPMDPPAQAELSRLEGYLGTAQENGADTTGLEQSIRTLRQAQDDESIFRSRPPTHSPRSVLPATYNGQEGFISVPQLVNRMLSRVQTEESVERGKRPSNERILSVLVEGIGALAEHEGITFGGDRKLGLGEGEARVVIPDSTVVFSGRGGERVTFGMLKGSQRDKINAEVNALYAQRGELGRMVGRWTTRLEEQSDAAQRERLGTQIADGMERMRDMEANMDSRLSVLDQQLRDLEKLSKRDATTELLRSRSKLQKLRKDYAETRARMAAAQDTNTAAVEMEEALDFWVRTRDGLASTQRDFSKAALAAKGKDQKEFERYARLANIVGKDLTTAKSITAQLYNERKSIGTPAFQAKADERVQKLRNKLQRLHELGAGARQLYEDLKIEVSREREFADVAEEAEARRQQRREAEPQVTGEEGEYGIPIEQRGPGEIVKRDNTGMFVGRYESEFLPDSEVEPASDVDLAIQDIERGVGASRRLQEKINEATKSDDTPLSAEEFKALLESISKRRAARSIGFTSYDKLSEATAAPEVAQRIAAWAQQLGLAHKVRVLSTAEAAKIAPTVGIEGFQLAVQTGELHGFTTPVTGGEIGIFVHPGLKGKLRDEIMAHEMGHAAFRSALAAADSATSTAILKDFEQWAGRFSDKTFADVIKSKKTAEAQLLMLSSGFGDMRLADMPSEMREYLLDFEEWFADRASAVLAGQKLDAGPVRQFFGRLLRALKKLFGAEVAVEDFLYRLAYGSSKSLRGFNPLEVVRAATAAKAASMGDFARKVRGHVEKISGEQLDLDDTEIEDLLLASYADANDPFGVVANVAFQQVAPNITSAAERNLLARMANKNHVRTQLQKLLPEEHITALESDTMLGAAYIYQLWQGGQLRLAPTDKSLLNSLKERLGEVFGYVADEKAAEDILIELHNGLRTWQADGEIHYPLRNTVRGTSLQNAARAWDKVAEKLTPRAKKLFYTAASRIDETGSSHAQWIRRQFHRKQNETGVGETYLEAKEKVMSKYDNVMFNIFGGMDQEQQAELLEALYRGDRSNSAANRVMKVFEALGTYATEAGVRFNKGLRKDYFPWVMDMEAITESADHLVEILSQDKYAGNMRDLFLEMNWPWKKSEAEFKDDNGVLDKAAWDAYVEKELLQFPKHLVSHITNNGGLLDLEPDNSVAADDEFSHTPQFRFARSRLFSFVELDEIRPYLSDDLSFVVQSYVHSMAKRAEYARRFGDDGAQLKQRFTAMKLDPSVSEQDLELARKFVNAMLGTLGYETNAKLRSLLGMEPPPPGEIINPKVAGTIGGLMTWQNLRVLGLALLSSFVDPIGIAVRTGSPGYAWQGIKAALKDLDARKKGDKTELYSLAEMLGIIDKELINDAMNMQYHMKTEHIGKANRAINNWFFKWNGMQAWTRGTRIMALAAGQQFLKFHVTKGNTHSDRFLNELGLKKEDVKFKDGELQVLTRKEREEATAEERARDDRVRTALRQFVDESIIRPTASQRPVWASDPHYALFWHLKSYMYSFQDRILKRVWNETSLGNYSPLLSLGMYLPVMFVGDLLRDILQGDRDEKEDWTTVDWLLYETERAGLYGTGSMVFDVQRDVEYGGMGWNALLGPLADFVADPSLVEALPYQNVYQPWFEEN